MSARLQIKASQRPTLKLFRRYRIRLETLKKFFKALGVSLIKGYTF